MAHILSLPTTNQLERPLIEPLSMRSRASIISHVSTGTTRHSRQRSHSLNWPLPNDSTRLASRTVLNYIQDFDLSPEHTLGNNRVTSAPEVVHQSVEQEDEDDCDVYDPLTDATVDSSDDCVVPFPPLEDFPCELEGDIAFEPAQLAPPASQEHSITASPFKRWLSTLRRRHALEPATRVPTRWPGATSSPGAGHQKSLSLSSSVGFLTAVKSATLTLAGTSIAPTSRHGNQSYLNSDNTSVSCRGPRVSMDSATGSFEPAIDGKAWYRSIQRRSIIDEILSSEESYISDMKAMIHVYFTLLASTPTMSYRKRESIQKSISQIIHLHEDLLAELQHVIPSRSDPTQKLGLPQQPRRSRHARWHSADNGHIHARIPGQRQRAQRSVDISRSSSPISRSMIMTTNTALNVAKVFDRFMRRFLAYEAYVAHHEIVHEEAHTTSRFVPSWSAYERGVEALSASTTAIEHKEVCGRKGLTLSDLGIKPIQRICKYPLFFADLCKHTPACDDPIVHAELEKVLSRLQETAEEINYAMDNPQTRHLIETTWLLQERLVFREKLLLAQATTIRRLGNAVLCGALHVAYETLDKVKGYYSVCILYRSSLVLATVSSNNSIYLVDAVVALSNAFVESPDSGRGLQCHTAPYTWKLIFPYQQKYYEILMSACSEHEEEVWKCQLKFRIAAEARDASESRHGDSSTYLAMEIKSIGPAFEPNNEMSRRLSIRRAATLGPKTSLRQVIIKNTHAQFPGQLEAEDPVQVSRSKSHMSSTHMIILAPRRSERVRLEGVLSDVWSRNTLPYPGMSMRRPENAIRASANSVMRKLSMASIASNFSSKRSGSFSTISNQRPEIGRTPSPRVFYNTAARGRILEKRRSRATVVNFHTAPAEFLPEDFELKKPTLTVRGQNFVRRTMTMDGCKAPPQVTLSQGIPEHKRSASVSIYTDIKALAPTPLQSEDSGYSTCEQLANSNRKKVVGIPSSNASTPTTNAPAKSKSRFLKLLGVNSRD